MWLFKLSGLGGNFDDSENKLTPEQEAALVDAAENFIAGGGHFNPGDWALLSPPEQAALVVANTRYRATFVAEILTALGAPLEAAKTLKPFDQGAAEAKVGLAVAVARAAQKYTDKVVQ